MNGLLTNARSRTLSKGAASPVPNVETALSGVLEPLTFYRITKVQNQQTGAIMESAKRIDTSGSVQPLKVRELAIKPEGERSWTWLKLFCLPEVILAPRDVVKIEGVKYRVMGSKPWAAKGYMYYELVDDYTLGNPSSLTQSASPSGFDI